MSPFVKIFVAIFCYISAVVGIGLAALNAMNQPPATVAAAVYGCGGAVFLLAGIALSRRPRY
jgi:hypothetical protein